MDIETFNFIITNPYIFFMLIGTLCAVLELVLIFFGKPNEDFQKIGIITTSLGLVFIFLNYLFGQYDSLAQALYGLFNNLMIFSEVNFGLMLVSAAILVFFLLFCSGSSSETGKIRGIIIRSILFSAGSIILRWLLTGV